jgi:hypothetical protein
LDVRRRKQQEAGENYIIISFINCTLHQLPKREIRLVGYIARREEIVNKYKSLVEKPEKKRLIERRT